MIFQIRLLAITEEESAGSRFITAYFPTQIGSKYASDDGGEIAKTTKKGVKDSRSRFDNGRDL